MTVGYLLLFQTWPLAIDYPEGVLKEEFVPVGIFNLLPGPLSESLLMYINILWPISLLVALIPRWTRLGLGLSFLTGCYALGYSYNYGRVFHGTSLALQILFLLAVGWPSKKSSEEEKENRAQLLLRLAQFTVAMVYFSSAITKLYRSGFAWAWSDNLAITLHTQALSTPLQEWLLTWPSTFLMLLASAILILELTSLLPVFFPALAPFFILFWTITHLGIHFAMGGHSTFFSHFFMYSFFLVSIKSVYWNRHHSVI